MELTVQQHEVNQGRCELHRKNAGKALPF